MAWMCSVFSVDVDCCPIILHVTPVLLFLNWSLHSYTLCLGQALFSYNAESL